jgi:hypothetical protein
MKDDEGDGLGFRFYLMVAGGAVAVGIALFVGCLIFARAIYAWGFFGAFLALSAILLLIGWISDRRQRRAYAD